MDDTKSFRKHADLMKKYVLTESAKIHARFNKKCGNCVEPAGEVKEDGGITPKICVCTKCNCDPCTCEKVEESPEMKAEQLAGKLKEILNLLDNDKSNIARQQLVDLISNLK